ncbi:MAG: 1-deoxy-D-xylulose-5-phosphate reductoisomerase [Synergistaceae bacterium]|nr:1-deoxy-D-xylulose-5-phosphate reductoisomerase [Synergistaceae bacterium]
MTSNGGLPRGIAVIGATGSVGTAVLDVCRAHPGCFPVIALAASSNVSRMAALAAEFKPPFLAMSDPAAARALTSHVPPATKVLSGPKALEDLVLMPETGHAVFASSGTAAISALMASLKSGKTVSLANKESLVIAGPWVMPLVREREQLRPLDSEHNAVWQCLAGERENTVTEIVLTASGGPFRDLDIPSLEKVTPAMALRHPVWKMGAKITIDSATLMNKGLEILEAMHLFGLPSGKVRAMVHPQSVVHGMVRFCDGSMKWLLSNPDMRIPAAVCLAFPDRVEIDEETARLSPLESLSLSFEEPDLGRFPCLALAIQAARSGGAAPAILVGADETAVSAFLQGKIPFLGIPRLIEAVLEDFDAQSPQSPEEAIAIMEWARRKAAEILGHLDSLRRLAP